MARPLGSKNLPKASTPTQGKIDLTGGVPATAPTAPTAPKTEAAPAKRVALGRVSKEKIFRAGVGQLTVHESVNGNVVFKGRMVDENGITYMTTVLMPLNPTTGKALAVSEVDIDKLIS